MADLDENVIDFCDQRLLARQPLVSVHMLAYQHEPYIAEAIESIVSQECDFPIELVIAEDCSPDNTLAIARGYQERYPELIRVITGHDNIGMHANSARSLSAGRGTYLAFCEGDDYWSDPTKLARQVSLLRTYPQCGLVFHAAAYVDSRTGKQTRTSRQSLFSRMLSTNEIILGDGGLIPTASILVRRDIAVDTPVWYQQAPVGDYALALCAALWGKIAYIDRVMSVYRTNVPHSWTQRYVPQFDSRIQYAREIEAMFAGFSMQSGNRFDAAARAIVSKYYSDPLVRLPGSMKGKRAAYREVASKLHGSDRFLAWLAVRFDLRLALLKDLLRKLRSLGRLISAHVRSERIREVPISRIDPDPSARRSSAE